MCCEINASLAVRYVLRSERTFIRLDTNVKIYVLVMSCSVLNM
jgi:hypothetical protein